VDEFDNQCQSKKGISLSSKHERPVRLEPSTSVIPFQVSPPAHINFNDIVICRRCPRALMRLRESNDETGDLGNGTGSSP
jgi:hypothetical protein